MLQRKYKIIHMLLEDSDVFFLMVHRINYNQHCSTLNISTAQTYIQRRNVHCIVSNNCCLLLLYPNQLCTLLSAKVGEGGRDKQVIQHRGDIH
jgi:hypothetical protein